MERHDGVGGNVRKRARRKAIAMSSDLSKLFFVIQIRVL